MCVVQQAQNSDNAFGVYSGGNQFKSQPHYRKYRPIILVAYSVPQDKWQYGISK
jgi:hypothetical protein